VETCKLGSEVYLCKYANRYVDKYINKYVYAFIQGHNDKPMAHA